MNASVYRESARDIPVVGHYDLIVCGGGTAGVPAAVSAARRGAKVALIEQLDFLGGVPAYAIMPAWHGANEYREGLLGEFMERLTQMGPGPSPLVSNHTEPEYVKELAAAMAREAGVEIHLLSFIAEVVREGETVKGVVVESKSGRRAFFGKVVIDATGDADVAYKASCVFMKGAADGTLQAMTIRFRIGNIDFDRYFDWVAVHPQYYKEVSKTPATLEVLRGKAQRGEEFYMSADLAALYREHPEYPNLPVDSYFNASSIRKNELSINGSRVLGVDGTKEEDLTKASLECRTQIHALYRFLREKIPGFADSVLVETAPMIGVRESRCVVGDYVLTEEDCRVGRAFPDEIAKNPIAFDLHDKTYSCEVLQEMVGIPYRSLLPKDVEGLLVAGRCLSADHIANSSVRRMHTAFQTGEAAGIAAKLAVERGITPRALPAAVLREEMIASGIRL